MWNSAKKVRNLAGKRSGCDEVEQSLGVQDQVSRYRIEPGLLVVIVRTAFCEAPHDDSEIGFPAGYVWSGPTDARGEAAINRIFFSEILAVIRGQL